MHSVDTNVLLRLIARDAPAQLETAENFVKKGIWISHLVLAEMTWVLSSSYGLSHQQIAIVIEMLLNHQTYAVQDSEIVEAALHRYRERPRLGFSDCLVLETARKANHLPLGTFDQNLAKLDGTERL